jgi:hypothetical protein
MNDQELQERLAELERTMGAPGFWERGEEHTEAIAREHLAVLNEATKRGLTTFDGS